MPDFGLFYKEWRQNKALLTTIFVAFMINNPFTVLSKYNSYRGCAAQHSEWGGTCLFTIDYFHGTFISLFWIWGVVLAVSQIGIERSKGLSEFTLSLPYTRGQVFNAKFIIGGMVIVVPQLIGYVLSVLLLVLLKPDQVFYFHYYSLGMIIVSMLAYSLVMAGGALTGHIFAQLLVSFTVVISPFLVITLPAISMDILFGGRLAFLDFPIPEWMMYVFPITYVVPNWVGHSPYYLVIPTVMNIMFYIIGYISFTKMSNERNGSFFLWKALDLPVQVIVIIFGILGFGCFGYAASGGIGGYLFGMAAGAVIGFLISYFAIYKKTKHL